MPTVTEVAAFVIAAIVVAAFSGPTWAWIALGALAALTWRLERRR